MRDFCQAFMTGDTKIIQKHLSLMMTRMIAFLTQRRSTIIIIDPDAPDAGIVIEVKYALTIAELDAACKNAFGQIKERLYAEHLRNEGRESNTRFGIAFCKKRCRVVREKLCSAL